MIFVINELKYDTDKMELISEKCEYSWNSTLLGSLIKKYGKSVKLWRSKKGNWLITYKKDFEIMCGYPIPIAVANALHESRAKELLLQYDIEAYEKIFGELEEA